MIVPWQSLVPVLDALDALGVGHHVGGSVASSLLAFSRATQDIDLVADLSPEHVGPLVSALGPDYYADEEAIAAAVRRRGSFNLIHLPTVFKIDVFVSKRDDFARENMARARMVHVEDLGREIRVCSPEDLVLQKLAWYRKGDEVSDRQWQDVRGVLRMLGDELDRQYLTHWAGRLGIGDLLDRLLAETPGLSP